MLTNIPRTTRNEARSRAIRTEIATWSVLAVALIALTIEIYWSVRITEFFSHLASAFQGIGDGS